jgi:hypothetical protein
MTKRQVAHKREIRKVISGGLIEKRVKKSDDWRGEVLSRLRVVIKQADPGIVEEVKWIKPTNPLGIVTWSHNGLVCTGETYKSHVKMTFSKGAALDGQDSGLFNSSLDAKVWRAIDIHEGDNIDETALKALIRAAVAMNKATESRAR